MRSRSTTSEARDRTWWAWSDDDRKLGLGLRAANPYRRAVQLRWVWVTVFVCSAARAQTAKLTIASDGCSPDEVRGLLVAQVGHDPISDSARNQISVEIRGTTATVAVTDGRSSLGERTITASNCADLVASVAVVLAMTVSHAEEPPLLLEEPRLAAGAFVTGAADLGGATTVTTGLELWRGRSSISAEARVDLPHDVAGGMINVKRAQASVSPCVRAYGFAGCVVASVGFLRGEGMNVLEPRTAVTPTLATGLRVVWQYGLTKRLALRVHADLAVNLIETRLDLDDMAVWTSPRVEGLLGAGIFARFR